MNDRALSLLEQYDIEVLRTRKGRGTFICETKQGGLTFQEYAGNPEKLRLQQAILERIRTLGLVKAEELIPNREGRLFVKDSDGVCYILKTHFEGNECDIYDNRQCVEVIQLLARLHHCMEGAPADVIEYGADSQEEGSLSPQTEQEEAVLRTWSLQAYSPLKEYEKHNREMMRVRTYLKKKGQKQIFEKRLLGSMEYFVERALQVTESWRQLESGSCLALCHGDFQHHNILRTQDGWRIVNFEKLQQDDPVRDVYLFMRKVMEKNNWPVPQGMELLNAYEAVRSLSEYSRQDLYHRFAYPEKFWKIVNFYYNSPKAWIPEKNLEKLEKVISQEEEKQRFLGEVFAKNS